MKVLTLFFMSFFIVVNLFNNVFVYSMENKSNMSVKYKQDMLLDEEVLAISNAVKKNHIYAINTLFKCGDLNPNITDNQRPLFFYAPTPEMALLFINNGVNVHATESNGTNVLQYLIDKNYPTDLIALYLAHDVNTRYKKSCLLHLFCHQLPKKNFANHIEIAKVLLTIMPDMINARDSKRRTPLDIAQKHCPGESSSDDENQSQDSSSGEDVRHYCKALCTLLKSQGSKTSQELMQKSAAKKNSSHNMSTDDDCTCIIS